MAWRVRTDIFDGPFDLLLALVSRQKVDVGAISIAELADQYLAEVDAMGELDLEVASDFMDVAASLLALKAASLLPANFNGKRSSIELSPEEIEEALDAETSRDVLIARLLSYRQFRQAAAALEARGEVEAQMHVRTAGPDAEYLGLMPDFLADTTLRGLAVIAADLMGRRQTFLLEADHVAPPRLPVSITTSAVDRFTQANPKTTFSELLQGNDDPEDVVVTLLAVLELYKLGSIDIHQRRAFGEIDVERLPDAKPYEADSHLWEEGI